MPFNDGIPKINCYSLTDFNDFDRCAFLFYVRHHLDKKYEIDESSPAIALGHILDQTIKNFHIHEYYGCKSSQKIRRLIREAVGKMRYEVNKAKERGKNHFYESSIPYMTEEIIAQAEEIFLDYYIKKKGRIKKVIDEVGFCEYLLKSDSGIYKIWGGPDTLEMGDDGIPEVCDYKSRQDIEKGKTYMDMDIMPKIYTLLCSNRLKELGYSKARFIVRFWQDPLEDGFYEEYDLSTIDNFSLIFLQKIERILNTKEIRMCNKPFCRACNSPKRDDYLLQIGKFGVTVTEEPVTIEQELVEV